MMQTTTELYQSIKPLIQQQIDLAIAYARPSSGTTTTPAVTPTEDFDYDGLGLSHTDTGAIYTLILTSSSYPGAAASILASDSSGRLGVQNLGIGIAAQTGYALYSSVSSPSYIANDLRIGTTAAGALSGRLHVLTTGTQAQFSYDTSNYGFIGVGSAGTLSIGNTGSTAANAHIYLNPGGGSAKVGIGNSIPTPTAKLEVNSTTEQLRLNYSGSQYASHTVSSGGNYTIGVSGSTIYPDAHLSHPTYVSQLTGWRISTAGEGDFRYLYTDELHAKAFIADLEQALAGGQIISKSVAKIYANFAAPTAGNTANLDVEEFAGFAAFHVFVDGDLVRIRQFDRSGGGLKITDIWGTVVYSAQVSSSNPPAQRYVFTRHATYPGTGSGTISAGTLVLDYGTTGNGYYEVNAIDGSAGANSPYTQIVTWATHPKSTTAGQGLQLRVRMGQLRGLTGISQFGLYAGTGWTANPQESNVAQYTVTTPTVNDAHRYILAGDNGVDIYNANLNVYSSTTPVITLDRTDPSLAIGSGSDTMTYSSGASGFWVGNDSGTYKMRLGAVSGGALTGGMSWDGSILRIIGSAYIGNGVGFSTSALLYLPFDTPQGSTVPNLNGHLGQVPTYSGPVTGINTGKYHGALYLEEGTTNLITNNSFETDLTGVTQNGGTNTRVNTQQLFGTWSLRCQTSTTGTGWYYTVTSVTSTSTTYTFSVYVRGTGSVRLFGYGNVSGNIATTNVTLNSTWTRYTVTFTYGASDTSRLVGVEQNGAGTADWYSDGTQLEQKSNATTFAATSRTVSIVRYDAANNFDATTATLSGWFYFASLSGRTATFFGGDNTGSLTVYANSTSVNVSRKDASVVATYNGTLTANTWYHIAVTVSGGTVTKLYINGALAASGTAGSAYATPTYLMIGSYATSGSNNINGFIDDVASIGRVLSADEIAAIYNSNAPLLVIRNNNELMLANTSTAGYMVGNAAGLFGYSDTTGGAGTGAFALVTTNSTALGTPFGSITADAGDMILGSASNGKSNLYWDQNAGSLSLRIATTTRVLLDTSGNVTLGNSSANNLYWDNSASSLSIRANTTKRIELTSAGVLNINDSTGAAKITLDGSGNATIAGLLLMGTFGEINIGSSDVWLNNTGLSFKAPATFADINTLKWYYGSGITAYAYSIVDTGLQNTVFNIRSYATPGASYTSLLSLGALNNGGTVNATFRLDSGGTGTAYLALNNLGTYPFWTDTNVFSFWSFAPSHGNGVGVIFIKNAGSVPTTNATNGGVLYVQSGALKYRGSSGSVTTLGVA